MAAYLQDFGKMARPALAQAAQTYGPAVAAGVKKGIKEGVLSLRNPQKASKYFSINSVEDLAKSPGNISAMIDENISAAAARTTSQTPFLNSLAGPGAGDKLHRLYYGNGKAATRKQPTSFTPITPSLATQARWQELASQQPVIYRPIETPREPLYNTSKFNEETLAKMKRMVNENPQLFTRKEAKRSNQLMGGKRKSKRRGRRAGRKTRRS